MTRHKIEADHTKDYFQSTGAIAASTQADFNQLWSGSREPTISQPGRVAAAEQSSEQER